MAEFTDAEIAKLRRAYENFQEIRSEGNGSAYGEHYVLIKLLRQCGVSPVFEASSQIENMIEHILTYGEVSNVF
jgi:hypothetical protein